MSRRARRPGATCTCRRRAGRTQRRRGGSPGGGPRASRGLRPEHRDGRARRPSGRGSRQPGAACRRPRRGCARGDRGGRRAPGGRRTPTSWRTRAAPDRISSFGSSSAASIASATPWPAPTSASRVASRTAHDSSPRSGTSSAALGPPVTAAAVAAAWARTSGWGSSSSAVAHRTASAVAVPRRVSSAAARTWCDGSRVRSATCRRDRSGYRASRRTTEKRTTTLGCRSSGTSRTPGRGARSSSADATRIGESRSSASASMSPSTAHSYRCPREARAVTLAMRTSSSALRSPRRSRTRASSSSLGALSSAARLAAATGVDVSVGSSSRPRRSRPTAIAASRTSQPPATSAATAQRLPQASTLELSAAGRPPNPPVRGVVPRPGGQLRRPARRGRRRGPSGPPGSRRGPLARPWRPACRAT